MASIVMLINNETAKDGLQYLNDVVGVFPDTHQFSGTELEKFNFLTISGTVEDVKAVLKRIKPRIETAYLLASDMKYHWVEDGDIDPVEVIEVFQVEGSNKWYKLINDFKFPVNLAGLTPEEKQLLETIDINNPSVDSFIRKIIKDVSVLSGNNIEVKELRNSTP